MTALGHITGLRYGGFALGDYISSLVRARYWLLDTPDAYLFLHKSPPPKCRLPHNRVTIIPGISKLACEFNPLGKYFQNGPSWGSDFYSKKWSNILLFTVFLWPVFSWKFTLLTGCRSPQSPQYFYQLGSSSQIGLKTKKHLNAVAEERRGVRDPRHLQNKGKILKVTFHLSKNHWAIGSSKWRIIPASLSECMMAIWHPHLRHTSEWVCIFSLYPPVIKRGNRTEQHFYMMILPTRNLHRGFQPTLITRR